MAAESKESPFGNNAAKRLFTGALALAMVAPGAAAMAQQSSAPDAAARQAATAAWTNSSATPVSAADTVDPAGSGFMATAKAKLSHTANEGRFVLDGRKLDGIVKTPVDTGQDALAGQLAASLNDVAKGYISQQQLTITPSAAPIMIPATEGAKALQAARTLLTDTNTAAGAQMGEKLPPAQKNTAVNNYAQFVADVTTSLSRYDIASATYKANYSAGGSTVQSSATAPAASQAASAPAQPQTASDAKIAATAAALWENSSPPVVTKKAGDVSGMATQGSNFIFALAAKNSHSSNEKALSGLIKTLDGILATAPQTATPTGKDLGRDVIAGRAAATINDSVANIVKANGSNSDPLVITPPDQGKLPSSGFRALEESRALLENLDKAVAIQFTGKRLDKELGAAADNFNEGVGHLTGDVKRLQNTLTQSGNTAGPGPGASLQQPDRPTGAVRAPAQAPAAAGTLASVRPVKLSAPKLTS